MNLNMTLSYTPTPLVTLKYSHPYGEVEWLEIIFNGWVIQSLEGLRSFRVPTARP